MQVDAKVVPSTQVPPWTDQALVDQDSPNYDMLSKRGMMLIFNQESFPDHQEQHGFRHGTNKDRDDLKSSMENKGFNVRVYNDCNYGDISQTLKTVRDDKDGSLKNSSCLLVVVMTHGDEDGMIAASDIDYPVQMLWKFFTPQQCSALAGKPKIFIILACRGLREDKGASIQIDNGTNCRVSSCVDTPKVTQAYSLPTWADFLFVYSTIQHNVSYRDPSEGTPFIQTLSKVLDQDAEGKEDVLSLLTTVIRKVTSKKILGSESYQTPCFHSQLTRKVFFYPAHRYEDANKQEQSSKKSRACGCFPCLSSSAADGN